jgi:hypothetical protein
MTKNIYLSSRVLPFWKDVAISVSFGVILRKPFVSFILRNEVTKDLAQGKFHDRRISWWEKCGQILRYAQNDTGGGLSMATQKSKMGINNTVSSPSTPFIPSAIRGSDLPISSPLRGED